MQSLIMQNLFLFWTFKKEVDRLNKIGVFKKFDNSQWAAPSFIIPKVSRKLFLVCIVCLYLGLHHNLIFIGQMAFCINFCEVI